MNIQLQYLQIQFKKIIGLLGRFVGTAVVLTLLVSAIAFYGTKLLYNHTAADKITIAVVVDDDSKWMELGMSYLESSESVHTFCRLVSVSKQEADQMLQDGRAAASIFFPKNFSKDIISGKNTPAVITYAGNTGLEELLFQELSAAASRILSSAQAGIYSFSDLYDIYDFHGKRSTHFNYLNQNALQTAYIRSNLFQTEQISSTNSLKTTEYYSASGIVLLLLLCGMPLGAFVKPERGSLASLLSRRGISPPLRTIWKCMALTGFYAVLLALFFIIAAAAGLVDWNCLFLLAPLALFSAVWPVTAYTITSSETAGTMLLFLGTLLCALCSGCLIPSAFLPKTAAALGQLLPTWYAHQGVCTLFTGSPCMPSMLPLTLYSAGFLWIACAAAYYRERRAIV